MREKCTCKWFVLVNFLEQKSMLPVPDVVWVVHPAFEHADRLADAVRMAHSACPVDHFVSYQVVEVRVARTLLEPDALVQRGDEP